MCTNRPRNDFINYSPEILMEMYGIEVINFTICLRFAKAKKTNIFTCLVNNLRYET